MALALLFGAPFAPIVAVALGVLFVAALSIRARERDPPSRLRLLRLEGTERRSSPAAGRRVHCARRVGRVLVERWDSVARDHRGRWRSWFSPLAVVALAALVLALYRQVGVLTLRVGPGVALELAEEGPVLGEEAPELEELARAGPELAVFFSPGCRLCRQLAPAVRALARDGLPSTSSTRTSNHGPSSVGVSLGPRSRCTSWMASRSPRAP